MGAPRTAFDADAGVSQGRILPTGWTAPAGDYVFVLGHDVPGTLRKIVPGDGVSVAQTVDLAGSYYLRLRSKIRGVEEMPSGLSWKFTCTINGELITSRVLDRTHELYDLSFPVGIYNLAGPVPIELGITLEGPGVDPVEVELPAVYLDAFTSETNFSLIGVCNRDPEPEETGVPLTLPVSFLITDPTGLTGIDGPTLVVTIGGVVAFSGSSGQNGYTADVIQSPSGFDAIITLTPPAPWISLTTYLVEIDAMTNAGVEMNAAYSWTAEDTLAPVLLAALAIDPLTVRVTFDEPMLQTGTASALDPAAYTFALVSGAPAVTPTALAVVAESPSTYLVTLDRYATRGALYSVTAAGLEDLFGNVVTAPLDTATFTGWVWAVPEGRDINLFRLLPEATQAQDEAGEHELFLGVMQEVFDLFFALGDAAREVWDPDLAPEGFVDLMLAEMGNPFELPLTLTQKRQLVQTLVPIYQRKGTGPGIVDTIRLFTGVDVLLRVRGWAPYPIGVAVIGSTFVLGTNDPVEVWTFEVHVPVFITDEQRALMIEVLDVMIVAHEHYRLIEPEPILVFDHWALNYSALGEQTTLH